MLADLINIVPESQKSFNIRILNQYSYPIELLVLLLAIVTAISAIRSFRASRRQNELATVPHIFLEAAGNFPAQKLMLVNDNDKLAFNFKIDSLQILNKSEKGKDWVITEYSFGFDFKSMASGSKRNFVSKGNSQIPIIVYANGEKIKKDDEGFAAWLVTDFHLINGLWVTFTDSQNLRFFTILTFNADEVTYIKRAPSRLTIHWRLLKFSLDAKQWIRKKWWKLRIVYYRLFD
jgi:hypothetical protein